MASLPRLALVRARKTWQAVADFTRLSPPQPFASAEPRLVWRPLLGAAIATCVVALFNGFPLAYPDTGNYLANAIDLIRLRTPWFFFRPLTYGVLLIPFATPFTIWLLPIGQGFLVAAAIRLTLRAAGVHLMDRLFIALVGFLSLFRSLSWFTGQIMPDVFTPVVILLTFVLLWARGPGRSELILATSLLTFSIATHLSHFPLYIGLVIVGLIMRATNGLAKESSRTIVQLACRGAIPLIAALGLVVGPNYLLFGRVVLSRSAAIFTLARLVGTGAAQRYLEGACPTTRYALCSERAGLRASVDWFLWDPHGPTTRSVVSMARGDSTLLREAPEIVARTVHEEWPALLARSIQDGQRQLISFGIDFGGYSPYVDRSVRRLGLPLSRAYRTSRQSNQTLFTEFFTRVHYAIVGAALASLLMLLPGLRHPAERPCCALIGMVLFGVVLNAWILAALSEVQERYESRVIWLVPFVAAVAALRWSGQGRLVPIGPGARRPR
jgi:hypothetical protein